MHPCLAGVIGLFLVIASASGQIPPSNPAPTSPSRLGATGVQYRFELAAPAAKAPVQRFALTLGERENGSLGEGQWLRLDATKPDSHGFRLWLLVKPGDRVAPWRLPPASILRYILQEGESTAVEYRDASREMAVLPSIVEWGRLWPSTTDDNDRPNSLQYLGHEYRALPVETDSFRIPPNTPRLVRLHPDRWIGVPSNNRQKDPRRRYDNSEYDYQRLTREDYLTMVEAGMTCVRVDAEQATWVESLDTFYWGASPADLPFPECLYRSAYLGPALFLDEPAVVTRDHSLRPRLEREPEFRRSMTPQVALAAFEQHFHHVLSEGAPTQLQRALAARPNTDLGSLTLRQANLYSWETMIASAAYQLSQDPTVPSALVFEPPGRIGTTRTLPEMNMAYGCQIPVDDPKNLTSILFGFLRGAARLTGKAWGTSIYGAVDGRDAPWFLTHAYDLGATRFFFWDNAALACVPFDECLALSRHLKRHADSRPARDLNRLRVSAEVAILLPPGYNLGHVHMGRGNLWGLGELNLERRNALGVPYRQVMAACFQEIERCLREGVGFDLLWDLPGLKPAGYREVRRISERGDVEHPGRHDSNADAAPRTPPRPPGQPPILEVALSSVRGRAPLEVDAIARVEETTAPVYYTHGADPAGIYHNAVVLWELFGPTEADYRFLSPPQLRPTTRTTGTTHEVRTRFSLGQAGTYRLRAATCDLAGRTTVQWTTLTIEP
ncbi:MAG: hypothetical protein IT581_06120 [Verrucomicrobiales bacterium]|nr:hypothetical protein [Verrucomicrobiales bacterium]